MYIYYVVDKLREKLNLKNKMMNEMHHEIEDARRTSGKDEQKCACYYIIFRTQHEGC